MSVQRSILSGNEILQMRIYCETGGYFALEVQIAEIGHTHLGQWRRYEHLTVGELYDVYAAVLEAFMEDLPALEGDPF